MLRPICEPVEMAMGTSVLAERVRYSPRAPAPAQLLHFHDPCEVVLFDEIEGWFLGDGMRWPITSGSIAFVPSMRHHDFFLAPGGKSWRLVQIDPYIVERLVLAGNAAALTQAFCARPRASDFTRLCDLADWLSEASAADPLDPLVARIAELLLLAIARTPPVRGERAGGEKAHVDRLLPAIDRLRRAPGTAITLEEAASLCSLSTTYFSRRFKAVFGMNFMLYARIYRLHLAARRISSTRQSVSEIAYDLGFSSPSHFTHRFHERFGMTPRAYRGSAGREAHA